MNYKVSEVLNLEFYDEVNVISNSNAVDWDKLSSNTILITKASDFIGFYLTLSFLNRNDLYNNKINIIALVDDLSYAKDKFSVLFSRDDIVFLQQDLSCKMEINEKADYIIYLNSKKLSDEVVTSVLDNTYFILNYAKERDCKSLLYVSSASVYGKLYNSKKFISENDIGYLEHTVIENNYAFSNRCAESLCVRFNEEFNTNVKIVRPDVVYGVYDDKTDKELFYFSGIDKNKDNINDISLKINSTQYNSYCYVTDAVISFLLVLLNGKNSYPYNISNHNSILKNEDYYMIFSNCFENKNVSSVDISNDFDVFTSPLSPNPNALDNSRLSNLGYTPTVNIKNGLEKAIKVFRERIK